MWESLEGCGKEGWFSEARWRAATASKDFSRPKLCTDRRGTVVLN